MSNTSKTTSTPKRAVKTAPKTSLLKQHIYRFTEASTIINKTRNVVHTHDKVTITKKITLQKERVGVIVALKRKDGTIGVGFSLCHRHEPVVVGCLKGHPILSIGDTYQEETAINMAVGRAKNPDKFAVPQSIQAEYDQMAVRAKKFFKVAA